MSGPMGAIGADVDMLTGLPIDTKRQEDKIIDSLRSQVVDAQMLAGELGSEPGHKLIAEINRLMAERIDWFMKQDEVCRTCTRLLMVLTKKTYLGADIAQQKIEEIMQIRAAR